MVSWRRVEDTPDELGIAPVKIASWVTLRRPLNFMVALADRHQFNTHPLEKRIMKSYVMGSLATILLLLPSAAVSFAQASMSAAQEAQQLRNDLGQLQDREAEIKMRLVELDQELRPENIERYFAGVGSTRPEELREARRKKLQIEKDRLQEQLGNIGQDRARLESAIQTAESRAYYESAMTNSAAPIQRRMSPLAALLAGTNRKVAAVAISLILIGAIVALVRHRKSRASR